VDSNCRSRWFLIEIAGSLPVSFSPSALTGANGESRTYVLGSVAEEEEEVPSAPCAVLTLTPTAQQKSAHLKMERREDVAS
jgi:hypothetical protein